MPARSGRFRTRAHTVSIVLALSLISPLLWHAATVNAWSGGYLRHIMLGSQGIGEVPDPPPKHIRGAIWLAREALSLNRPELAISWAQRAHTASVADALGVSGLAREAMGDFHGAVEDWVRARDWRNLHGAAARALSAARLDDALYAYRALGAIDPERAALPFANYLWWPYGDTNGAIAALNRALTSFPDSSLRKKWLIQRGDFLRFKGRLEESERDYLAALELDPDEVQAYLGLGWARYGRTEAFEGAAIEFQRAIDLAPEDARGYREMARLMLKEGRWEEADMWYQQALELAPESRWLWLERGNAARDASELRIAFESYAHAIKIAPDWALAHYELSLAYHLAGQGMRAVEAIRRALELMRPESPAYYLRAARIYDEAGMKGKAMNAYRRLLELQPGNQTAQAAIERLASEEQGE